MLCQLSEFAQGRPTFLMGNQNFQLSFDDSDKTCVEGIKKAIKKYPNQKIKFVNGGDRTNSTTPEKKFCEENNIDTLWSIGGSHKTISSSWILDRWKK